MIQNIRSQTYEVVNKNSKVTTKVRDRKKEIICENQELRRDTRIEGGKD